jgi:hypothetical protein
MSSETKAQRRAAAIDALINTPTEEFLARRREIRTQFLSGEEIKIALAARPELPRPLVAAEREVLLALLNLADFPGRDALVSQVEFARVDGYCACPCASFSLVVDPDAPQAFGTLRPAPNEADVVDADGALVGGIILFTEDGYLSYVDVHSYDEPISPMPPVERLRLRRG